MTVSRRVLYTFVAAKFIVTAVLMRWGSTRRAVGSPEGSCLQLHKPLGFRCVGEHHSSAVRGPEAIRRKHEVRAISDCRDGSPANSAICQHNAELVGGCHSCGAAHHEGGSTVCLRCGREGAEGTHARAVICGRWPYEVAGLIEDREDHKALAGPDFKARKLVTRTLPLLH